MPEYSAECPEQEHFQDCLESCPILGNAAWTVQCQLWLPLWHHARRNGRKDLLGEP